MLCPGIVGDSFDVPCTVAALVQVFVSILEAGSHDTFFVSWAFPSRAIGIGQVDIINFDGAAGDGVLVEREIVIT